MNTIRHFTPLTPYAIVFFHHIAFALQRQASECCLRAAMLAARRAMPLRHAARYAMREMLKELPCHVAARQRHTDAPYYAAELPIFFDADAYGHAMMLRHAAFSATR